MKRSILALSRDRGSMQAIAPVIAALNRSDGLEVSTYATRESWPVAAGVGLRAVQLDERVFASDPVACMHALFDFHRPVLVLSGSSPSRGESPETPEQYAVLEARRRGVPSVAVLDYWGMYVERFSRDGSALAEDLLPDHLCVLDRRALADLEALGVNSDRMAITHNPWLDRLVRQASLAAPVQALPTMRGITVLLASQPLAEMRQVRNRPYDQYNLFEYLLAAMADTSAYRQGAMIQILPHPSEDVSSWEAVLASKGAVDVKVELCHDSSPDLLRDADYIVTSHSTLAYEALYFGTPCISLRPAAESLPCSWIDDVGLSRVFYDVGSLRQYLSSSDPIGERQSVLRLKSEMEATGLFFSDGKATGRVVKEVARLLNRFAGTSSQQPS